MFNEIVENSQYVATRSKQISQLTKQQESAVSQIFLTLKEISEGIRNFVTSTSQTTTITDTLKESADGLKSIMGHFKVDEAKKQENETGDGA